MRYCICHCDIVPMPFGERVLSERGNLNSGEEIASSGKITPPRNDKFFLNNVIRDGRLLI